MQLVWLGITLFSALCNKRNKQKKRHATPLLPNFPGILTVNSVSKGRMRITLPILQKNKSLATKFVEQFSSFHAIKQVSCNLVLGSVCIHYNEDEVEPMVLQGAIFKTLGLDKELQNDAPSRLTDQLKQGLHACNYAVASKTNGLIDGKGLLALAILGVSVYQIRRAPLFLPNGYSLLRYGLLALLGKRT